MKMKTKFTSPLTVKEWCRGCGICIVKCPENVLVLGLGDKAFALYPDKCTCCKLCESSCPDRAITVVEDNADKCE